jgi:hypothetical protein
MPLDALPDPTGMFTLERGTVTHVPADDRPALEIRYTSHFATCPDADEHRKPR